MVKGIWKLAFRSVGYFEKIFVPQSFNKRQSQIALNDAKHAYGVAERSYQNPVPQKQDWPFFKPGVFSKASKK